MLWKKKNKNGVEFHTRIQNDIDKYSDNIILLKRTVKEIKRINSLLGNCNDELMKTYLLEQLNLKESLKSTVHAACNGLMTWIKREIDEFITPQ